MTGSTLSAVLTLTKAEAMIVGTADDALFNQLIVNKQSFLCERWEWSIFEDRWDSVVAPFQQYVSFPTVDIQGTAATLRLDRDLDVSAFWNNQYQPLTYGIGEDQYNTFNPALQQYNDPILNWMRVGNDKTKYEVWPVPASQQVVRFVGQRTPTTINITNPNAIVELDDMLIATSVAADYLKTKGKLGWDAKARMASELFLTLRGNDPQENMRFKIGMDTERAVKARRAPLNVIITHG